MDSRSGSSISSADFTPFPGVSRNGQPGLLGAGQFGEVWLMQYTGSDPQLQAMSQQGPIVVKKFKGQPDNDIVIAPYLQEKQTSTSQAFTSGIACQLSDPAGGKQTCLVGRFVSYHDGPPPASKDLQGYLEDMAANQGSLTSPPKGFGPSELSITMSQLAASMKETQNALHNAGVLHCDTACRNYLVNKPTVDAQGGMHYSVTITDFGLSEKIPKNGVIPHDENKKTPLLWQDCRSLNWGGYSIATDLYALRVSMVEMAAGCIGISTADAKKEIFCLPDVIGPGRVALHKRDNEPYASNDGAALECYLGNLQHAVEERFGKDSPQCEQVGQFIKHYKPYLITTIPVADSDKEYSPSELNRIRRDDARQFAKATERFNHDMIRNHQHDPLVLGRLADVSAPARTRDKERVAAAFSTFQQSASTGSPGDSIAKMRESASAVEVRRERGVLPAVKQAQSVSKVEDAPASPSPRRGGR